ncbi:DUF861 domain-containing protein [Oleomonas cavernae]|uniref:DUF861 domain-containing protein n=2 Tax=Oleomonas cavernae TaxID=2320859 RepID=A0A418WAZ0_9PROT|nr:DUF861 domain-containing protein [Oleomonas cavernae]
MPMPEIKCFKAADRTFETYMGSPDRPEKDYARIAKLVGPEISQSMGGGVVTYRKLTAPWSLPFDELVVVLDGAFTVTSAGKAYDCVAGDVLWFPAHTPLTYEVADFVTVFYAKHPVGLTAAVPS